MSAVVHFREQLSKQLQFLQTSCDQYDAGNVDEAIRIATVLRVMFHNSAKSTSLLVHLGATSTEMLSTCGKRLTDNPNGYWPGLVQIEIDIAVETLRAKPKFNATPGSHRMVPFSAWWDGEVVYFGSGHKIKRNRLILDAANKDGGAHVDVRLPKDYEWMVTGTDFSFAVQRPDGSRNVTWLAFPHLACLRQMAYEVFESPALLRMA
jgi:hypothetical protein